MEVGVVGGRVERGDGGEVKFDVGGVGVVDDCVYGVYNVGG